MVNIGMDSSQTPSESIAIMQKVRAQVTGVKSPSIWIFPGGFIGKGTTRSAGIKALEKESTRWPATATLVAGFDYEVEGDGEQHGIALRQGKVLADAKRWHSSIPERTFSVGKARIAMFVCGEFVGSKSANNGPYTEGEDLNSRVLKHHDIGMAVCLSHDRVPRCRGIAPLPRRPHQRQMQKLSGSGIATALVHHHDNEKTASGSTNMRHLSDWFLEAGTRIFSDTNPQVID